MEIQMLDPIEYYLNNFHSIQKTAKYLAIKRGTTIEEEIEEIKSEFYAEKGSKHSEILPNGYSLSSYLERIRHLSAEHYVCIGWNNREWIEFYHTKGTQFECEVNLLILFSNAKNYGVSQFYVVHNHPLVYRACPSNEDYDLANSLLEITINYKKEIDYDIGLLDFGIVTEYDYWSMMQHLKEANVDKKV